MTSNSNCLLSQDYLGWLRSFGWSSGSGRLDCSPQKPDWAGRCRMITHVIVSGCLLLAGSSGEAICWCAWGLFHMVSAWSLGFSQHSCWVPRSRVPSIEVEAVDTHSEVTQDHFWQIIWIKPSHRSSWDSERDHISIRKWMHWWLSSFHKSMHFVCIP